MSDWTNHVKKYAKEHGISYMCAISDASKTYTKKDKKTVDAEKLKKNKKFIDFIKNRKKKEKEENSTKQDKMLVWLY